MNPKLLNLALLHINIPSLLAVTDTNTCTDPKPNEQYPKYYFSAIDSKNNDGLIVHHYTCSILTNPCFLNKMYSEWLMGQCHTKTTNCYEDIYEDFLHCNTDRWRPHKEKKSSASSGATQNKSNPVGTAGFYNTQHLSPALPWCHMSRDLSAHSSSDILRRVRPHTNCPDDTHWLGGITSPSVNILRCLFMWINMSVFCCKRNTIIYSLLSRLEATMVPR